MGKTATRTQAALAKARQRRVELDADRDARDRRVEEAAAEAMLLVAERAQVEGRLASLNTSLGAALRRLLDDGITAEGVARLVDINGAEVRRLTRPSVASPSTAKGESAHPRDAQPKNVGEIRQATPGESEGGVSVALGSVRAASKRVSNSDKT